MRPIRKRSARDARGLHVEGPGFYLWDSDPREALRLAAELKRHRPPPPTVNVRVGASPRPPLA